MLQTPNQYLQIGRAIRADSEPIYLNGRPLYELDQTQAVAESFSDGLLASNCVIGLLKNCCDFCDVTEGEVYLLPTDRNEFEKLVSMYGLRYRPYDRDQVIVTCP